MDGMDLHGLLSSCSMVPRKKLGPSVGEARTSRDGERASVPNQAVSVSLDSVGGVVQSLQSWVLIEGSLSTSSSSPIILISVNDDGVLHWPHSAQ
jgi:hypothetical protein